MIAEGFSQFRETANMLVDTLSQQQAAATAMFAQTMRDTLPFTPTIERIITAHGWRDGAFSTPLSASDMRQVVLEILSHGKMRVRNGELHHSHAMSFIS